MVLLPSTHANVSAPGGGRLDSAGVWSRTDTPGNAFRANGPALFLDRDGVINADVGYLRSPQDVRLLPGIAELILAANTAEIPVIVITNQSGVGRGYLTWEDFAAVQARIAADLAAVGALWDMVLACPFHSDALPPYDIPDHPGRKPNTGMIETARRAYALDLSQSWIIGDKASDVECGKRAGLAGAIHAATHDESMRRDRAAAQALSSDSYPVITIQSIREARRHIPYLAHCA